MLIIPIGQEDKFTALSIIEMIFVYQIYYNEYTRTFLDNSFYPYENIIKDEYFESTVLRNIYEWNSEKKNIMQYIGVSSWKQYQKTHIIGEEIIAHIKNDVANKTEKDIYLYSPITSNSEIKMRSDYPKEPRTIYGKLKYPDGWRQHKDRSQQLHHDNKLLNDSGVLPVNLFDGKWIYSKCNYWIATRQAFDDYLRNWLIPAMDFLKSIEPTMPRHYRHSGEGRPTTSICFTLEYLFGSFLAHSNYSFEHLVKKNYPGMKKKQWIKIEGHENINPLIEKQKIKTKAA